MIKAMINAAEGEVVRDTPVEGSPALTAAQRI
jgi:hypothetical protein